MQRVASSATAFRVAGLAIIPWGVLSVAVLIGACFIPVVRHSIGYSGIAVFIAVLIAVLVGGSIVVVALFVRAHRLDLAERRAGWTTGDPGTSGLERRDRRTGGVMTPTVVPPPSIPAVRDARPPIRGGSRPAVTVKHGWLGTLASDHATVGAFAFCLATFAIAAVGVWLIVDDGWPAPLDALIGLLVAAGLLTALLTPFTRFGRIRSDQLGAATGVPHVWSIWQFGDLDDLVFALPEPGTRSVDPTATLSMMLTATEAELVFWSVRGRTVDPVLTVPVVRLVSMSTALDWSSGQPQQVSALTVAANDGSRIELPMNVQATSWRLRAASRDCTAVLQALARAATSAH